MFHWICPECGQEIAPGVKECPVCEPQASTSPLPSAGQSIQADVASKLAFAGPPVAVVEPVEAKPAMLVPVDADEAVVAKPAERSSDPEPKTTLQRQVVLP